MMQVLMWAQLRGNSQNLVKVVSGGLPRDASERPPAITHDATLSARIDGGKSFGMLAMRLAVDTALRKACDGGGMAIVGTNNTASGTGALG
jgi:LDH2 family malate/lactate/ureidoglycolate dehydrogenase